ncbi:hypothetical protein BDV06DRAFT_211600 [Aspergillus oleicola]
MALAAEWSRYAVSRRGIRVSWNPQSAQRSTYFLSLPYRYAIPLITVHTILHWLISQRQSKLISWPGYNPIAIVISLSVGTLMFVCLVGLGFRRLSSGIILAGSCSLAIAASCHPRYDPNLVKGGSMPNTEKDPPPIKWGAIPVSGDLGHCSLSSGEVNLPEEGRLYQ